MSKLKTWLTAGMSSRRGHVARHEKGGLAVAERVEGRGARALVHVAVSAAASKPWWLTRDFWQGRDIAFAVAEDDPVGQVFLAADQLPQAVPLGVVLRPRGHEALGDRRRRRGRAGHLDPLRVVQNMSASRSISGGIVAEKNSVCRVKGTIFTMRSISGMKPMSSMRSASSMTRSSTPVSRSLPRSKMIKQPAGGGESARRCRG